MSARYLRWASGSAHGAVQAVFWAKWTTGIWWRGDGVRFAHARLEQAVENAQKWKDGL